MASAMPESDALPPGLGFPEPRPFTLRPPQALLVVVDMENEFLHPRGRLYLGPRAPAVIAAVARVVEEFRRRRAPVVFLRSVRSADAPEHVYFHRPLHLLENTWAVAFADPLVPRAEEAVVEKRSHDAFNHTALEATVDRLGVHPPTGQVVVVGVATNVCVHAAVVGFSVRNFQVGLPMDCTMGDSALAEWAAYHHLSVPAYRYNVTITRSDLLRWEPVAGATEA